MGTRTVKAWAVVEKEECGGDFLIARRNKETCVAFGEYQIIVPCTITYELPNELPKKKARRV